MDWKISRRSGIHAVAALLAGGTAISTPVAADRGSGSNMPKGNGNGKKAYKLPKGEGWRSEVVTAETLEGVEIKREPETFTVTVDKDTVPSKNPRSDPTVRRQQEQAKAEVSEQVDEWASQPL